MKIETKCEIGDTVWVEVDGEPQQARVAALNILCRQEGVYGEYVVMLNPRKQIAVRADRVYHTLEDLLKNDENIY